MNTNLRMALQDIENKIQTNKINEFSDIGNMDDTPFGVLFSAPTLKSLQSINPNTLKPTA